MFGAGIAWVDANLLAASAPGPRASGWPVNVGAGARTSLLGLIGLIGSVAGHQVDFVHQPPRSGDVRDSLASLDRAERILGYKPRISLEAGLRRTWTWMADGSRTVARGRAPAALRQTA